MGLRTLALGGAEPKQFAGGGELEKLLAPFSEPVEPFGFYGFVSYQDIMAWHRD